MDKTKWILLVVTVVIIVGIGYLMLKDKTPTDRKVENPEDSGYEQITRAKCIEMSITCSKLKSDPNFQFTGDKAYLNKPLARAAAIASCRECDSLY